MKWIDSKKKKIMWSCHSVSSSCPAHFLFWVAVYDNHG